MGRSSTKYHLKKTKASTSLAVQWLKLYASTTRGAGLIHGWVMKILHVTWCGQKTNKI